MNFNYDRVPRPYLKKVKRETQRFCKLLLFSKFAYYNKFHFLPSSQADIYRNS